MSQEKMLLFGLELSNKKWVVCFGEGSGTRRVEVAAGDQAGLLREVEKAKKKFGLPEDCRVASGYEAGRDGFWIHRFLWRNGICNRVMDPASIPVERRGRRKKTDKIDARKLLGLVVRRELHGEKRAFSEVRVPDEAAEEQLRLGRERDRLKKESTMHRNRLKSLLVLHGVKSAKVEYCDFTALKDWQGRALPGELVRELNREQERLTVVRRQLKEIEKVQGERLKQPKTAAEKKGATMATLRGLGKQSSWMVAHEYFGWRTFANGKEVGGASGLVGTPYDSGESRKEQGISKAGNRRIRRVMVELAWLWLRHQPNSALSRWFRERFEGQGQRLKRIGIVALARKLLVALWRFVEFGQAPEGAVLGGAIR